MLVILSLLACIYLAISSAYVSRSLVLVITGILVGCHWNYRQLYGTSDSTFLFSYFIRKIIYTVQETVRRRSGVKSISEKVVSLGNLDLLKLLRDNDYKLSSELYLGAVKGGRINILEWWLKSENNELERNWEGSSMCGIAAERDAFPMLQWLRQKGCRWCKATIRDTAKMDTKVLLYRRTKMDARGMHLRLNTLHLELLRWLL